ncbi:MAG: cysteine--tRNA ligase, partial [Ruegeria sp.]
FSIVQPLLEWGLVCELFFFVLLPPPYHRWVGGTEKKAREAERARRGGRALRAGAAPAARAAPAVIDALADDMNTAGAITELHRLAADGDAAGLLASAQVLGLLSDELGAWAELEIADFSSYEERLASARAAAMVSKDFSEVDRLKSVFLAAGLEVRMSKDSVELVAGTDFDPAKLESI